MICGEGEWRPSKRTYPTLDGVTEKTDRIHLKDAARMLEVSVMTIRRDLSQDDDPLPLTLLGGYIVMVNKPTSSTNMPLPAKKTHHRDDLPVAILAAGLVRENDLVFLITVRKCH